MRSEHKQNVQMYTAIHLCSLEPFPWTSPGGARQCLLRVEVSQPRDSARSLLWPERTQGTLLASPGDTRHCVCPRQCPCLLLPLCWVSSLGSSSSFMPGGEAAPACRLSRRTVLWGKGSFPVPPPAQPKAWASPEQGQGKQEAAGAG